LDMEDYESIAAFVKKCETLARIDITLLNAGLQNSTFKTTAATKHEQTVQVNYISTALLTILLLPVLKSKRPSPSKPALISVVTSDTAYFAKLEAQGPVLPRFDDPKDYSMNTAYPCSKLLVQFFITKLAEQVSADDVIINMVNPGLCAGTSLSRDQTNWVASQIFAGVKSIVGRSTQDGASTYVDAIVAKGKESHGSYCSDWKIQPYVSPISLPR
jgi:NAD(P)-dependent dehydrogenase (short-subunit alcohol dehydrogenase family)